MQCGLQPRWLNNKQEITSVNTKMNEYKEITFYWRKYFFGEVVETSVFSIIILSVYLIFDFTPWILLISFAQWAMVVFDYFDKKTNVSINLSGILIDGKCIKWDNVAEVNINSFRGSCARRLVVVTKDGNTREFCYFPISLNNSSLMVDYTIRGLSGDRVHPKADIWIKYIFYPICKCAIFLFCKEHKNN